eukprot:12910768-Prorocentrum_lima.AAC.1
MSCTMLCSWTACTETDAASVGKHCDAGHWSDPASPCMRLRSLAVTMSLLAWRRPLAIVMGCTSR